MYRGIVTTGRLVKGSEIEMRDGVKIPVNCDKEVEFSIADKVERFYGIGEYYDKRTKLTYNTEKGLFLYSNGIIGHGYVEPFEFGNLRFYAGEVDFDNDGDIISINN